MPGVASGEVLLECSFVWASKLEAKLLVTLIGAARGGLRAALSSASRAKVRREGRAYLG